MGEQTASASALWEPGSERGEGKEGGSTVLLYPRDLLPQSGAHLQAVSAIGPVATVASHVWSHVGSLGP